MANATTLSEKIYNELYDDIIQQKLVCGQKLTLSMLKERFSVSHTPIREALTRLAENGLVVYYSNCGVKVIEMSESDICEIFQFIGELDALSILFCKNSPSKIPLIYELKEIVETGQTAMETQDLSLWKSSSEQIHKVFYNYAQNRYLNESASRVRAKVKLLSSIYYVDENITKIQENHMEIYQAIKKDDFEKAANLMRIHLQHSLVYALKSYKKYRANIQFNKSV